MATRRIPTVKEAMTPFPHQIDVQQGMEAARKMMIEHRITHLPVKDGGKLIGIVTDRDLEVAALASGKRAAEGSKLLRELCQDEPHAVDLHTPLDQVVREMGARRLGSVLVTKDERLAGILTTSEICRRYGELLRELAPPDDEPA